MVKTLNGNVIMTERKDLELNLKVLSRTDSLTSLYSRRHMMHELELAFERFTRDSSPTAVLMLDIDLLKKINDSHGHGAGDAVLIQFAHYLQSELRDLDLVGRSGGGGFMIIMAESTVDQAEHVTQRLLNKKDNHENCYCSRLIQGKLEFI